MTNRNLENLDKIDAHVYEVCSLAWKYMEFVLYSGSQAIKGLKSNENIAKLAKEGKKMPYVESKPRSGLLKTGRTKTGTNTSIKQIHKCLL